MFSGCQSTNNESTEESFTIKSKPYTLKTIDNKAIDKFSMLKVSITEKEIPQSPQKSFNDHKNIINKDKQSNKVSTALLNKQACRDNINVTYRVTNQNAVSGKFQAKVQAQGIIISISQDQKTIKLKTTGWFTQNENLQQWQPYLKNPPLAKGILLKIGAEFWDKKSYWYLCGAN